MCRETLLTTRAILLSVLSKMAARNCIFVKHFLGKYEKNTPLQLDCECSGVLQLNLVTLHCEPVTDVTGVAIPYLFGCVSVSISIQPGDSHASLRTGSECNVTKLVTRKQINTQRRTAHSAQEGKLCAVFLKKGMTRKRIKKVR